MKRMQSWLRSVSDMRRWHRIVGLSAAVVLLAVSSSGVLLSAVPVMNALAPEAQNLGGLSVADLLSRLEQNFAAIEKLTVTPAKQVIVEHRQGNQVLREYVDVQSGQVITPVQISAFYQKLKSFHRSLWLGAVGRAVVAFAAFAMLILCVSGLFLLVKRQGGWRGLLLPAQGKGLGRWHSLLGQLFSIPLLLMGVTGVYLALDTFGFLPKQDERVLYPESREPLVSVPASSLSSFGELVLADLESILYPIPEDWFDVYSLKTKQGYVFYDQFTGEELSSQQYSSQLQFKHWMLLLHSGQGAPVWSVVLGVSALAIPFFSVSGVLLWWRKPKQKKTEGNAEPAMADAVILVGSETQTTWQFAGQLWHALADSGLKVHQGELNSFQHYPNAKWLFVLTATYGNGDAPSNAQNFLPKLLSESRKANWQHAVLGFGDRRYQNFCLYAQEVGKALGFLSQPLLPLHMVDQQNAQHFQQWGEALEVNMNARFDWSQSANAATELAYDSMRVVARKLSVDGTVLQLRLSCSAPFQPGDLLAVRRRENSRIRLYSIASDAQQGHLELCIKKVAGGECSNYLHQLTVGDVVQARVQRNPHFQLPPNAARLVMIATGTGLAPFAGIIANNRTAKPMSLFFGCRHPEQDHLYAAELQNWCRDGQLRHLSVAYSRTQQRHYVQDLLVEQSTFILDEIRQGAVVMVCGSQQMASAVALQLNALFDEQGLDESTAAMQLEQRFIVEAYG